MVSEQFIIAVKLSGDPAYRIAQKAGLDPTMLSKLIHGIIKVKPGDQRVLAVGQVLGIPPGECFKEAAPQ
jgi:hypothetical protein